MDDLICVRVADFDRNRFKVVDAPPTLRAIEETERERRLLSPGDLLIEKSGGGDNQPVGCVVEFTHSFAAVCSNFIGRLPIAPGMWPRYWAYVHASLYSGRLNIPAIKQTTGIQNLDTDAYFNQRAPFPPHDEQRAIAEYLDRQTARLDALVAAKERALGLLAEKRRALITRAVTRGLDPRPRLFDSGIPWLGQIPAHWEAWKLAHVALVGNGSTPNRDKPEYWEDGTIPWLNSSVVNQEEVTAADQFVTALAFRECHLPLVKPDSVLVGITGQGKTRGSAVVLSLAATINQHIAFITPNAEQLDSWFLRWTLFTAYEYLRSISDDAGGTKGALTCEAVAALNVPLPPLNDQREIVAHIASETRKLDALMVTTERTISLLKERRAALISAAVTGQIDVRHRA